VKKKSKVERERVKGWKKGGSVKKKVEEKEGRKRSE
jgi:hypothetical protein